MRISDWSSDVCSSDLNIGRKNDHGVSALNSSRFINHPPLARSASAGREPSARAATAYSHQEMGIRAVADTCCRITSGIARMRLNRNDGDAFAAHKSRRHSLPDSSDRLSLLLPKRLLPDFAFRFFFDSCRF